jgi:hypothetical protein
MTIMTSQIVNVAIVLIGIYIALAVACSWLQEQIAAVFKLRSSTLLKGIAELVSRDADVLAQVSNHPLILSGSSEKGAQFPSYIDPRNFTQAFWQSVGPVTKSVVDSPLTAAIVDPKESLTSLVTAINAWSPANDTAKKLKMSAVALLNSAEGDYDKLLKATDAWFDAQMDRVSGWYKRTAQYYMLAIALVMAFGAGIDTIDIGRQLYASPAIAQAVSASVTAAVDSQKGAGDTSAAVNAVASAIKDSSQLQDLQVVRLDWWMRRPPTGAVAEPSVAATIFGMIITTIAISLGAPFWFDILKGIINVRMAGQKPAEATAPAK